MNNTKTVVIALIGMVLQNVITLATGILVARALGPTAYGEANLMRSLVLFCLMLSPLGLDVALQKYIGGSADHLKTRVTADRLRLIALLVSLIGISTLPLGLANWINSRMYHLADFASLSEIAFLSLPAMTDLVILGGVFRAMLRPDPQLWINYYLQPLLRLVLLGAVLRCGFGVSGVLWANTIASIISVGSLNAIYWKMLRAAKANSGGSATPPWSDTLGVLEPAAWMAVSVFFYSTIRTIDVLFLASARPMRDVGEYGSLSAIAQLVQFVPVALSLTLGPTIARLFVNNDIHGMQMGVGDYIRRSSLIAAPIFAAVVIWGTMLDLLFGRQFEYTSGASLLLPVGYYISGVLGGVGFMLSMTGNHRQETAILIAGNVVAVALCYLWAPGLGQIGVAAAIMVAYILINGARYLLVIRKFKFVPGNWSDLLAPIICILIAWGCRRLGTAIAPRTIGALMGEGMIYGVIVLLVYWVALLKDAERAFVRGLIHGVLQRVAERRL